MEYLKEPELYISEVLARVKPEFMQQRYGLPEFDPACHPLHGQSLVGEKLPATESIAVEEPQTGDEGQAEEKREYPPEARWPVDADLFLELVAKRRGKLLKVSCRRTHYRA